MSDQSHKDIPRGSRESTPYEDYESVQPGRCRRMWRSLVRHADDVVVVGVIASGLDDNDEG